jgi:FkbM family methyltransferase
MFAKMFNYLKRIKTIFLHPANRHARFQAVWRALSWQFTYKRSNTPIDICAFGYQLRLYPNDFITRAIIYYTPFNEYHSMKFVERYLRPGDSFIDIGANIGTYSLLASALVGETGSVESFEPGTTTYKRLQENINRNQITQVNLHQVALGATEETVNFTTEYDATNFVVSNSTGFNAKITTVPCQRLDRSLSINRSFAMAKIDVEGYELSVLQGATSFLGYCNPPVIQLEINGSSSRYGIEDKDLIDFLKYYGYEPAIYNAETNQLIFTEDVWDEVLFISKTHQEIVLQKIKQFNANKVSHI